MPFVWRSKPVTETGGGDVKTRKKSDFPTKTCATCLRPFVWRKKWAAVWDEVRYCSDRCRGQRPKSGAGQTE